MDISAFYQGVIWGLIVGGMAGACVGMCVFALVAPKPGKGKDNDAR